MTFNYDKSWNSIIHQQMCAEALLLVEDDQKKYKGMIEIFPPDNLIFNAFNFFKPNECRVIIIGQDPYHGKGQAMGLSFSVPDGVKIPPSLRNIFKELSNDFKDEIQTSNYSSKNGDLTYLAKQGVLLLNRSLTVRQAKPNSHRKIWQKFTKNIFDKLLNTQKNMVIFLWGNDAKDLIKDIDSSVLNNHLILTAVHPSPLSANRGGWFNQNLFTKANTYLVSKNLKPIKWLN